MHSITLINVFFGPLPDYFRFFIETCKWNSSIRFIFFSDAAVNIDASNIDFIKLNLAGFNQLASEKLDLSVNVTNPYKLCDFKPAYGKIFEDYIVGTEFWGCTDIDILYGNIRAFVTEAILFEYDIISSRVEYLTGHFTIFRNVDRVNNLFKKSPHCRFVFTSADYCCFDECSFLWVYLLKGASIFDLSASIFSMTHIICSLEDKSIRVSMNNWVEEQDEVDEFNKFIPWKKWLEWRRGTLFIRRNEIMYFHFHLLKHLNTFFLDRRPLQKPYLFVNHRGIYTGRLRALAAMLLDKLVHRDL